MTAAEHVDLTAEDMDGLLARIKSRDLREADFETMAATEWTILTGRKSTL